MGTWGPGIFQDDLAADLRDEFRDLIGDGLTASQATEHLQRSHVESLRDQDEAPVFWLALAAVQWKLGHVDELVRSSALKILDERTDLSRWTDVSLRRRRQVVLERLSAQLRSAPPPAKHIAKRVLNETDWQLGEIIGLRLKSGIWTLMRVIGYHADRGGRFPLCEILDWVGHLPGPLPNVQTLTVRPSLIHSRQPQFMLPSPRRKKDKDRLHRTGVRSAPGQKPGGYTVMLWNLMDAQLSEVFGLE